MTDSCMKLLTQILDANRFGVGLNNGVLVASTRDGAYIAWKPRFEGVAIEISRPTVPELVARMEEMGWLE